MNKEKIYYRSSFWIVLYAAVAALMMCMQFTLGLLDKHDIVFQNKTLNDFVNGNLSLPITVISYGWTLILGVYCVCDRSVDILKTSKLQIGHVSMGDLAKLRKMILISLILLIVALVFSFLVDKDFDLSAWATAFVMAVLSLTTGNKLVKASSYFGTHDDKNENGVPDEAEDMFDKWKREQTKNGVDPDYITWEYFLDDPENEKYEKKYRPSTVKEEEND